MARRAAKRKPQKRDTGLTRRQRYYRDSGLTQREIAEKVGLAIGQVNGLLRGMRGRHPWEKTALGMAKMAKLFGVSYTALWGPDSLKRAK